MTVDGAASPTAVIAVSERSCRPDGSFLARVSFGDGPEFDVTVADPAEDGDEERLAWYFEEHLRYPFLDGDLADDAVTRLRAYGERLFAQVFAGGAATDYRVRARRGFDGCRLRVRGSAAFHRLHWEALYDPELPVPSVLRLPVIRQVDLSPAGFELPPARSTLNIMVVTARPGGSADVGYRTISRPLLAGLRRADRPVVVDLVRPGTWAALRRHLDAATKRDGSGYYQVIHFDVHGAVAGFDALERGRADERYLFGSGRPAAFEGERAFLFFETATEGVAEPVSAQDVAELLAEHRVPGRRAERLPVGEGAGQRVQPGPTSRRRRCAGDGGDGVLGDGLGRRTGDAAALRRAVAGRRPRGGDACGAAGAVRPLRQQRQALLARVLPPAPTLNVYLSEAVLRRPVPHRRAMREQLRFLARCHRRHNVGLRVVPLRAGLHAGAVAGSFTILDFPDAGPNPEPTIVYVESLAGALYLDKPAEVRTYTMMWASLSRLALSEEDSAGLISLIAEEYVDE